MVNWRDGGERTKTSALSRCGSHWGQSWLLASASLSLPRVLLADGNTGGERRPVGKDPKGRCASRSARLPPVKHKAGETKLSRGGEERGAEGIARLSPSPRVLRLFALAKDNLIFFPLQHRGRARKASGLCSRLSPGDAFLGRGGNAGPCKEPSRFSSSYKFPGDSFMRVVPPSLPRLHPLFEITPGVKGLSEIPRA